MSEHNAAEILSSKLSMPRVADIVSRERLLSLVDQAQKKRLTTVVAGAGYGKTTLIAHAASSWSTKTVWYRLDESDSAPITFLSYILAGIRKLHPDLGYAKTCQLKEMHYPENALERISKAFLGELEKTLREDMVIVLDDYHCVIESREIGKVIELLLRDLSSRVHLVLISRSELPLPLARLRAMREVIDIGREDLSFSLEEVERLCTQVFGLTLDPTKIDALYQRTGGWISGLILLLQSLKGSMPQPIGSDILNLKSSRGSIFTYFDENVFGALPREKQEFLIKTSVFTRISASLCDRLLSTDCSLDVLKYLEDNHLFTYSDSDGWYYYHRLFRDFLQSRLKDEPDGAIIPKLNRKAAVLPEGNGEEKASHPGLRIYMLGKFRVFIGEKELPINSWKSRKARALFQFLVYSRSRGHLNKEILMELLWPDEDPALTVKRLHVALVSLRKTLNPHMIKGSPSSYLSRAGDSYRVDIGSEGWIDLEVFSEMLKLAGKEKDQDQAIGHLLNAVSLYGGDFMEEEPYSEWCFEAREKFRKDYLGAVGQIVAYYERRGKYLQCIEFAEMYLACDRYAETIYRSLLISYCKTGDKFKMARTFKKCRESIMSELNCRLSEETEALYRELVGDHRAKAS